MTTKMRWVLGVCIVIGVVLLAYILGTLLGYGIKQWVFTDPTPTSTVVVPTATSKAQKAEPTVKPAKAVATAKPAKEVATAKPAKPTALVEPTAAPQPTILVGDEGPCKGSSKNIHFLETEMGVGNSNELKIHFELNDGQVLLAWGSLVYRYELGSDGINEIPFSEGRTFVTVKGPWKGDLKVVNGAFRKGQVLTDMSQVQSFWGDVIDCDLQRSLPVQEQRRGLYRWFKINW